MEYVNGMRFSIIIGAYNHIKTLPKLIESLHNQSFQDFEVIICDDRSNDGTWEYLKSLNTIFPLKIRRPLFKLGMRLSRSINKGIKEAKGEHCLFVMGDSFLEMNYLEILNEYMDEDTIVCGARINVEENKLIELDWRLRKGIIPKEPVLLISNPWNLITGNGLCVPTSALRRYGGWHEGFKGYGGDDNELVARMYYKGYLVWSVPQAILYHNFHYAQKDNENNGKLISKLVKQYGS